MATIISKIVSIIKKYSGFLVMIGLMILASQFGGWGWLGFILINLVWAGYMMFLNRDLFKSAMQQIEILIWGKPKEALRKGEKRPKVKIMWGKHGQGKAKRS